jgi:hypothetical protein
MKRRSGIGAYVLVALGVIFLLSNFGLLPHLLVKFWWPAILIVAGILLLVRRSACKKEKGAETAWPSSK